MAHDYDLGGAAGEPPPDKLFRGEHGLETLSSPTGRSPESTQRVDFNTWFTENPQLIKVWSVLTRVQRHIPISHAALSAEAAEAANIIRGAMSTNNIRDAAKGSQPAPEATESVKASREVALAVGATELQGSGLWVFSETQFQRARMMRSPGRVVKFCPFCGLRNMGPHTCDPPKD